MKYERHNKTPEGLSALEAEFFRLYGKPPREKELEWFLKHRRAKDYAVDPIYREAKKIKYDYTNWSQSTPQTDTDSR